MARFMLPPRNAPAEVHKAARDQFVQLMKTTLRKQSNEARDKIADSLAKNNISRDLVRNWEGSPFTRPSEVDALYDLFADRERRLHAEREGEERDWDKDVEDWVKELEN